MEENQILLIDKPAGISSFGVVAKIRGKMKNDLGKKKIKVGHTGTLDPFATGLLIILTGTETKKSNDFLKLDKVYEATLKLGQTSTTGDPEGEIIDYKAEIPPDIKAKIPPDLRPFVIGASPMPDKRTIKSCLKHFTGPQTQKVPSFSAVKINGERAYKLARAGKTFDTPTREIEIYKLDLLEYKYPVLKIRADVSSGTNIRTLAEDIGEYLNTGAYLTALRRTKIASYSVKNATTLDDFLIQ